MLEGAFQNKVLKYLKTVVGGHWIKIHASSYQSTGEPDIVGCYKGRFYGLELKRPDGKGKASVKQIQKLSSIRREGGIAMVIDNMETLKQLFDDTSS